MHSEAQQTDPEGGNQPDMPAVVVTDSMAAPLSSSRPVRPSAVPAAVSVGVKRSLDGEQPSSRVKTSMPEALEALLRKRFRHQGAKELVDAVTLIRSGTHEWGQVVISDAASLKLGKEQLLAAMTEATKNNCIVHVSVVDTRPLPEHIENTFPSRRWNFAEDTPVLDCFILPEGQVWPCFASLDAMQESSVGKRILFHRCTIPDLGREEHTLKKLFDDGALRYLGWSSWHWKDTCRTACSDARTPTIGHHQCVVVLHRGSAACFLSERLWTIGSSDKTCGRGKSEQTMFGYSAEMRETLFAGTHAHPGHARR